LERENKGSPEADGGGVWRTNGAEGLLEKRRVHTLLGGTVTLEKEES